MDFFIDIFLHIDQHLITLVQEYHEWTYALLFLIIFCETGLVVTPFLPGDSLLFVSGAVASLPGMPLEISLLMMVIFIAAVLGDSCNYLIGHYFGKKLFSKPDSKIFKYNPQIQISAESETKRSIFREKDKTKRSKKESAQHSKSRNKSFVMTSVSAL